MVSSLLLPDSMVVDSTALSGNKAKRSDSSPFATTTVPSSSQPGPPDQEPAQPQPADNVSIPLSSLLIILVSTLAGLLLCACLIYRMYIREGKRRMDQEQAGQGHELHGTATAAEGTAVATTTTTTTTTTTHKRLEDEESRGTQLPDWPFPASSNPDVHASSVTQNSSQEAPTGGLHAYSSREELLVTEQGRRASQRAPAKARGFFFMPW